MRYLDPKADLTFKHVFGEHPDLVISLLNALLPLNPRHEIREIEYLPAELVPENPLRKNSIVDVRCLQSRKIHPFLVQDNIADFLSERWMFISPRKNGDPIRVGEDDLFIGCGSAKSIKQVCCFALTFHYICII